MSYTYTKLVNFKNTVTFLEKILTTNTEFDNYLKIFIMVYDSKVFKNVEPTIKCGYVHIFISGCNGTSVLGVKPIMQIRHYNIT